MRWENAKSGMKKSSHTIAEQTHSSLCTNPIIPRIRCTRLKYYETLTQMANFTALIKKTRECATILIMLTSWLLIQYGQLWGAIYSVFLIIALFPLSFVLFKYGIWLSFAIPWAAVQLRQLIDF